MKFSTTIYILAVVICLFFTACAKVTDDNQNPTVTSVRLNINDTLQINNEIIHVNEDSISINPQRIDTLILGKYFRIKATFSDNIALSSYVVRIDSTFLNEVKDSAAFSIKALGGNIFGKQDITVRHQLFQIPDSIKRGKDAKDNDIYLPTREGNYKVQIYCMDESGKVDSTFNLKVKILSRQTIYKIRSVKK